MEEIHSNYAIWDPGFIMVFFKSKMQVLRILYFVKRRFSQIYPDWGPLINLCNKHKIKTKLPGNSKKR